MILVPIDFFQVSDTSQSQAFSFNSLGGVSLATSVTSTRLSCSPSVSPTLVGEIPCPGLDSLSTFSDSLDPLIPGKRRAFEPVVATGSKRARIYEDNHGGAGSRGEGEGGEGAEVVQMGKPCKRKGNKKRKGPGRGRGLAPTRTGGRQQPAGLAEEGESEIGTPAPEQEYTVEQDIHNSSEGYPVSFASPGPRKNRSRAKPSWTKEGLPPGLSPAGFALLTDLSIVTVSYEQKKACLLRSLGGDIRVNKYSSSDVSLKAVAERCAFIESESVGNDFLLMHSKIQLLLTVDSSVPL